MDKRSILVIFGGCSPEYSVSLESATGVLSSIDRERYDVVTVGITKAGDWFYYDGPVEAIENDAWAGSGYCAPCAVSPDRSVHELLVFGDKPRRIHIDAAFPVLHGRNGEDGTVQGIFELAGIPLAGCGVLASALCMDKARAHALVSLAGVRVPRAIHLEPGFDHAALLESAGEIGLPLFVKPVRAGSSYGITKVSEITKLLNAVDYAFRFDDQVIVEEAIPGFEVGCAVMGSRELVTGEIDEIELSRGFFDFTEKYNLITSQIHVPARISREKSDELKQTAMTIYKALYCRGFARVDMFLTPGGDIVFNEVNTIPGFTPHSRFPSMMKAVGVTFTQVITRAIELALEDAR